MSGGEDPAEEGNGSFIREAESSIQPNSTEGRKRLGEALAPTYQWKKKF